MMNLKMAIDRLLAHLS